MPLRSGALDSFGCVALRMLVVLNCSLSSPTSCIMPYKRHDLINTTGKAATVLERTQCLEGILNLGKALRSVQFAR
jgi:hypothetical protein